MGKKSAPSAPNPYTTAAAQTQANTAAVRESARLNAIDQYGPLGSSTYIRDANGIPTGQRVTLNPLAQTMLTNQLATGADLSTRARQLGGQLPTGPLDLSGLPSRQGVSTSGLPALPGVGDFSADAAKAQDAAYGKAMSLMRPDMDTSRARLVQSLSDRGIPLDSVAGKAELDRMDRSQSEAMSRAAYDAVSAGGQEQSRLFGLASTARGQLYNEGLSTASANSQLRQAGLSEALALRNQPYSEFSAINAAAGGVQMPSFQSNAAYQMQAPDIAGLIGTDYQNRLNSYNQRQQGLWGTMGTLGMAAFL